MILQPFSDDVKGLPYRVNCYREKIVIYQDHSEPEIVLVNEPEQPGDLPQEIVLADTAGLTIICFCNPRWRFKSFKVKLLETNQYFGKPRKFRGFGPIFKSDPDSAVLNLKTFDVEKLKTIVHRQLYFNSVTPAQTHRLPATLEAEVYRTSYKYFLLKKGEGLIPTCVCELRHLA
jgi:hypothetical protein